MNMENMEVPENQTPQNTFSYAALIIDIILLGGSSFIVSTFMFILNAQQWNYFKDIACPWDNFFD
jgi:hypothetical protein